MRRGRGRDRGTNIGGTNRRRRNRRLENNRSRRGGTRSESGSGNAAHKGFLLHNDGGAVRGGVEEDLGHFPGQTDATVRSRVRRDVTLMHGVAAPEKMAKGYGPHERMRGGRLSCAKSTFDFKRLPVVVHIIPTGSRYGRCFPATDVARGSRKAGCVRRLIRRSDLCL